MTEILLGMALFTAVVCCLAVLILAARAWLLPTGEVRIRINAGEAFNAAAGSRLIDVLAERDLHVPQACGGRGTCGLCRVRVLAGGGAILPVERDHISRRGAARGERLACQVLLREDLTLELPDEILGARQFLCTLRSCRQVGVLMKELIFDLPSGEAMEFQAGAFVQVTCPSYRLDYQKLDVPDEYAPDWARLGLRSLKVGSAVPVTRAYSMANQPGEGSVIMLLVRLALPPPGASDRVPPGKVSSWLFGLLPGDEVMLSGPHGHFHAEQSEREMVFLGGGAGMAPLRAHILAQLRDLHSGRRISFWYGARSQADLLYVDLFNELAREHDNFSWTAALSEPRPGDVWDGPTGFIHQVALDRYLEQHPEPEACVYYLCGPPVMTHATVQMLLELGVERESIHSDEFGG